MEDSLFFCKWPWQFKQILAEYPVVILTVTRLLLEQGERNESVRSNYLLVENAAQNKALLLHYGGPQM